MGCLSLLMLLRAAYGRQIDYFQDIFNLLMGDKKGFLLVSLGFLLVSLLENNKYEYK